MTDGRTLRLSVLMPLRDDWASAGELIRRIDTVIAGGGCSIDIILVDDGSAQRCNRGDFPMSLLAIRAIHVLRLRRNLGHQRAIAIGLAHLAQINSCEAVAVMDADGEDTAEGLAQLIRAYRETEGATAVFAERSRRSESLLFRSCYSLYKGLHWTLTGIKVRVGNFSILPASYLSTLAVLSELWNHYAAAVFRSRLRYTMTPIPRGKRIAGASQMNFVALVSHGLSALSVFGDIVGVRLLIGSLVGSLLAGFGIVIVAIVRLDTERTIPGWATVATGTLAIIMMQLITIATSFTLFMLSNRTNLGFVPARDYAWFIEDITEIYSHE